MDLLVLVLVLLDLGLVGEITDQVDDSAHNTPSVGNVQVHLGRELAWLEAEDTENGVGGRNLGVDTRHEAQLHDIGARKDGLCGPAGKLAVVVLHFSGKDGTALGRQLRAPVGSVAGALGLGVELVEGLEDDGLVLAGSVVLEDSVDFGTDDDVDGLFVSPEGEVEAAVLEALGGQGFGLLLGVIEGVSVGELELVGLGLDDGLEGEVVVDDGGFESEIGGGVDGLSGSLGGGGIGEFHGGVRGVLVDGDKVNGGVAALVEEDLVALLDDHNVPGVDRARSAHEHGQNISSRENGGFVLLSNLLDNRVRSCRDVVRSAFESKQFALGGLAGRLVVRAVIVVKEAIVIEILSFGGIKVQLRKTGKVDFLKHVPLRTDSNRRISVALRLVPVSPSETATASTTTAATTTPVIVESVTALSATGARTLELATASTALGTTTLSTTATEDRATTTSKGTSLGGALVVDDGEGRFVLCDLHAGEKAARASAINLLVCRLH